MRLAEREQRLDGEMRRLDELGKELDRARKELDSRQATLDQLDTEQVRDELTYPGQIRVTVIRESRVTELAR